MDTKGQFPLELECSANLRTRIFAPSFVTPASTDFRFFSRRVVNLAGARELALHRAIWRDDLCVAQTIMGTGRRPSLQINIARRSDQSTTNKNALSDFLRQGVLRGNEAFPNYGAGFRIKFDELSQASVGAWALLTILYVCDGRVTNEAAGVV